MSVCGFSQGLSENDKLPAYHYIDGDTLVLMRLSHLDSANVKLLEWQMYRTLVVEQQYLIAGLEESLESARFTTEQLDLALADSDAAYKAQLLANNKLMEAYNQQVAYTKQKVKVVRRRFLGITGGALIGGIVTGVIFAKVN